MRLFAFCVGVAGLIFADAVSAQHPRIIQTSCDTLSFNPFRVAMGFAIDNQDPSIDVCGLTLVPVPISADDDSCYIHDCGNSPGWICHLLSSFGVAHWDPGLFAYCVAPGQRRGGFSLVIAPHECCYAVGFFNALDEVFWEDTRTCFTFGQPVPTLPVTWGRLKSIYR